MKEAAPLVPGTLYLVATPIGNLHDITLRALHVLRECDVIAAEDTRHTGQMLQAFEIKKPMLSYFKFNEARRGEEIIQRLKGGAKVALVTDAGTPGISDPGERVVRAAIEAGCRVEPVPGACAFVAGLTASGLPADEFHFAGFLPHKSGQRRKKLEALKGIPGTAVLYESPYRVEKLLVELQEVMPRHRVVLARELTKKFEEFLRGTPSELIALTQKRSPKGEFVVLIAPPADEKAAQGSAIEPTELVDAIEGAKPAEEVEPVRSSLYEHPVATVGALIYNSRGEVLMIRTHKWSDLWGIPGGKPKFGESAEDALRREIKEETALDVEQIKFVLVQDCIRSTEFYRDAHFVLLNYTCLAPVHEPVQLNDEAEEYRWVTPAEAMQLPLNTPTKTLLETVQSKH